MKHLFLFFILLTGFQSQAQYKFLANNCSNQYSAKLFVVTCDDGHCGGRATIILYDKISGKEINTFNSADLDFDLNEKQDAKLGWLELGKHQSPLIFGDFNFDGNEDLAIRNGSNGAFMSPSYDIYLATADQKFYLNTAFSQLASENLGLFTINNKNKQLITERKDGCCYYITTHYVIDAKNKPVEISSVLEDTSIGDDVTVITRKTVNGKVFKTIQRFKAKDYYKP